MENSYDNENWKSTYERRMKEAVKELYAEYTPEGFLSSPEAAILENITGYTSVQLEKIREITEGMEEKLIDRKSVV